MQFKAFLKRFQFEYLTRVLKEAATRFPLATLCCAAGSVLWILFVHDWSPFKEDMLNRLGLFSSTGLFLFTSLRLFAEGAALSKTAHAGVMAAGAAVLAGVCFVPDHFTAAHMFFCAAVGLSILFAPYIARKSSEDSVWYFNYQNGIGFAVAGLSVGVLCTGVSAIVGSLDYLFPALDVSGKIYGDIWVFGFGFFGPVAVMYQIPKQFDFDKEECFIPKGIYFIANYLAVPLVLIYTFILYVYFAKIVFLWSLPKGNLAYMVTGFGGLGIALRLAVFPMRENGTVLLQQFYKYFFWLLLIPLVLLAIGLYTRIAEYGVTEERYAILLCLVWLSGLAGYYILKPAQAHIKHVPAVLAVLFLLASFGPWGAVPVSTHSQVARLENALEKAGVIIAGKPQKTAQQVPFKDRQTISSILEYLYDERKDKEINWLVEPFRAGIAKHDKDFNAEEDARCHRGFGRCWWSYNRPQQIVEAWGMKYVGRWQSEDYPQEYFNVRTDGSWYNDSLVKVAPYDYYVRLSANTYNNHPWVSTLSYREEGKDMQKLTFRMDETGVLTVEKQDGTKIGFALKSVADAHYKKNSTLLTEEESEKLVFTQEAPGLKAKLRVYELSGNVKDNVFTFTNAQVAVLVSP